MRYLLAVVAGPLPPEEIDPRLGLGFGSRSGLALGLGAIYVSSIYVAELGGILSSFMLFFSKIAPFLHFKSSPKNYLAIIKSFKKNPPIVVYKNKL